MNRGQFFKLVRHPGSVNKQMLQTIERLLYRYPYFQGARILVARSKQLLRQLDARKSIQLASLYTTDKQQFKDFMLQTDSSKRTSSGRSMRRSSNASSAKQQAKAPTGRSKKPSYVVPTLSEQERKQLVDSVMHELDNLKHNMSNFTSAEQSRAFRLEEMRKASLDRQQARATFEAQQKGKEQTELEIERHKLLEEQKRLEAERKERARTEIEAERQKLLEDQKRLEAERKEQARTELEAERHKLLEEQKRLEAERKERERNELEAERHKLLEEQKRYEVQKAAEAHQHLEEKIKTLEHQLEAERHKLAEEQKRYEVQKTAEINQRIEEKIKALEAQKEPHTPSAPHSPYDTTSPAELTYTHAHTNAPSPYSYGNYNASYPASYPVNYPYVAPMQAYPFPIYFHPHFSAPTASHLPTYAPSSSPLQFSLVLPQPTSAVPTNASMPLSAPMQPPIQVPNVPSVPAPPEPLPSPIPKPAPPAPSFSNVPKPPPDPTKQHATIERFMSSLSKDKATPPPSDRFSSSDTINEEICSEELAELYHNQGHIERAIEIYHRLCDRYPEKSQHFLQKIKSMRKT